MGKEAKQSPEAERARAMALFVIATLFRAASVAGNPGTSLTARDSFAMAESQVKEAEAQGVDFERLTG